MKILMIDNFDSFTYNLVQYFGDLGAEIQVFRNNAIAVEAIQAHHPDGIVISPGPGTPDDSGITLDTIRTYAGKIPIFGVCLGHQAIGQAFGGKVVRAKELMHGKTSQIYHKGVGIFADLPSPLIATRYHSLVVAPESLPDCLMITANTVDSVIMGVQHKTLPVYGVQFHPESFLTVSGRPMLQNFLNLIAERKKS